MNVKEFQSLIFKFSEGDYQQLNSKKICIDLLQRIAELSNLNTLEKNYHQFSPHGVSAVFILSESHIAIHTWPESGSGYISLTTCKKILNFEQILDQIQEAFKTTNIIFKEVRC